LRLADDSTVSAVEVLAKLDGARPDLYGDLLSDYLDDGERSSWRISGGDIALKLTNESLLVETTYEVAEPLNDDDCLSLLDYTVGQWADGFGDCADGLGPSGMTVSIWHTDSTYGLETSWLPGERSVTWVLVALPRPHRVAAFSL